MFYCKLTVVLKTDDIWCSLLVCGAIDEYFYVGKLGADSRVLC